jgi:hypothetical protein
MDMADPSQRDSKTIGEKAKGIIGQMVTDAKYNEVAGPQNNYYFYGDSSGLSPKELGDAAFCQPIQAPELLPHMVNRSEQHDRLCSDIKTLLQREDQRLFLCVIPGDDTQCHRQFVARIQEKVFPRFPALSSCVKTITPPFPTRIKHPDSLHDLLQRALSEEIFAHSDASLQEIKDHFSQYAGVVSIPLYVRTDDLGAKGPELLARLVAFWRQWQDLQTCRCVFVSLCIEYKTLSLKNHVQKISLAVIWTRVVLSYRQWRRYRIKRKTNQWLHSLEKEYSSKRDAEPLVLSVLPPLGAVSQGCVENWASSKEVLAFLKDKEQKMVRSVGIDLVAEVKRIYRNWETSTTKVTIPMEDLVKELFSVLNNNPKAG